MVLVVQAETAETVPLQLKVQHMQLVEMAVALLSTTQVFIGQAVLAVAEILQVTQLITVVDLISVVVEMRPVQLTS